MKSNLIKAYGIVAIAGVSIIATQCTSSNAEDHHHDHSHQHQPVKAEPTSSFVIPKMQDRKAMFGSPEELDQLLDIYDNARLDLEANSNNTTAKLRMAEVFIQEARITGEFGYNFHAALALLDNIITSHADRKDVLFQALTHKATIKLSQHKFKDALEIGKKAMALNNRNSGIYGVLVDAYVELGDYENAVSMSDKMVNIRPDLRSYSRISYLREIHGQNAGAIEAMKLAISAGYPGFEETSWCRVILGGLYENAGDLTNAEAQYRLALQERENYPYALAALGRVEMKKTNYNEAEELINQALKYIHDAGFYADLSMVHKLNGDEVSEATALKQAFFALEGQSNNHSHEGEHAHDHGHSHEVGLEMAKMFLQYTQDYDKAMSNALHEYEIRPTNIEVNQVLAGIYFKQNNLEKAEEHLQKALATNAQNSELNCLAGLIAISKGNDAEGKKLITQSFSTDPYQMHYLAKEAKTYL